MRVPLARHPLVRPTSPVAFRGRPYGEPHEEGESSPRSGGYERISLERERGRVECRWYPAEGARAAVFVGGVGGGWDTPARGLYPTLCRELSDEDGIGALRIRFRFPTVLEEATFDVLAGLEHLESRGLASFALVGHSFGGAVVVRAAAAQERVRTVVTLATQAYGAEPAADLGPRASLLLVHGTADEVLPAECSRRLHGIAAERKRLVLYERARHGLDEVATELRVLVRDWIRGELGSPSQRVPHAPYASP